METAKKKTTMHSKFCQNGCDVFLKVFTVLSRALTLVTIQKIKSFGVLQFKFYVVKGGATNQDMSLTETC